MKPRYDVAKLTDIPNIGKALSKTFCDAGLCHPCDFINQDPYALFDKMCQNLNRALDPCVLDTLISAVDYMNGGRPKKWYEFTAERKKRRAQ